MARVYSNSEFEDILIYFANSILGQNTEEEIAWDLAKNCISKLGFEDCVVYFVDEHSELLVQKAAYGPKNPRKFEISDPLLIPIGEGITGFVAKYGKSELINDTALDTRYIIDDQHRLSEVTVPIIVDGKVFGIIDCEHAERNFFTKQHLRILEAIASICSVKISNVRIERANKEQDRYLMAMQNELLTLKIEALRTQMNPHFLFNAINSIQYFITIGERRSALQFLSTLSKLIRHYLSNFERDTVTIGEEMKLMQWYLDLQKMRYTNSFEYEIRSTINEYQSMLKIPNMVLGSFTESILEGSVFDNDTKGKARINIGFKNKKLQVTAYYTSAGKRNKSRLVNYRENIASWEDQIILLNRLKGYAIEKEKQTRYIITQNINVEKVTIAIPSLD